MLPMRLAIPADHLALQQLIVESVRGLSVGYYSGAQIESALRHLFGPDTQLISDRTYYVIEDETGTLIAAGGWSRRQSLHGGDQWKCGDDPLLDPVHDAGRIRAFFVHPAWARRGLARRLFDRCAADAYSAGFRRLELTATLPGIPLYQSLGFVTAGRSTVPMPDGLGLEVEHMVRPLPTAPASELVS